MEMEVDWELPMIKLAFPLQDLNVKSWEERMPSKVKMIHSDSNSNLKKRKKKENIFAAVRNISNLLSFPGFIGMVKSKAVVRLGHNLYGSAVNNNKILYE